MTISDILLVAFSATVIPSLYLLGRYSRNARRQDAAKKNKH